VIETDNFNLMVEQEKLTTVNKKKINPRNIEKLPEIISKYINTLPETPYTAMGFNFVYTIEVGREILKNIFLINDKKLTEIFSNKYEFGGIIKFSFENFIVTLTIKPQDADHISGSFNFHYASQNKENLIKNLSIYQKARKFSEKILKELFDV